MVYLFIAGFTNKNMEKKLTEKPKINVLKGMPFADDPKFDFDVGSDKRRLFGIINKDKEKITNSLKLKKSMF